MADINFNPAYGDITILRNDIIKNPTEIEDKYQKMVLLFKTNFNDFKYSHQWEKKKKTYIGMSVDNTIAERIKYKITSALVNEKIVNNEDNLEVLYIIGKNTINFRVLIKGLKSLNLSFMKEQGFKLIWVY